LKTHQAVLEIETRGRGFVNVTERVARVVRDSGVGTGLCAVFCQHTSASLVIQENADPAVLRDLERWLADLAPESRAWEHDDEGPDDMPAHAKSAVTRATEMLPVSAGRLAFGTWQSLYVWEHRAHPHTRRLVVTVQGD
jgi:secondary thiamine-phosphate synthase enzyme